MNSLGRHTEELNALPRQHSNEIEEAVEDMTPEDVARHVPGGWHILNGVAGEEIAD